MEENKNERQLRGLYKHVKISVSTLNKVIIALCAALIIVLAIAVSNRGFTITFDTTGGTSVEAQRLMYGDFVEAPEEPQREGYAFSGWYADENLTIPWDIETDTVTASMTLYAAWTEK